MPHRLIKNYCNLSDTRGHMNGIINNGKWEEVNIVTTNANNSRGGHFHRQTIEVIFMLSGRAEVELSNPNRKNENEKLVLVAGEGLEIFPETAHTFHYLEDSSHLQLLSSKFNANDPDLIDAN